MDENRTFHILFESLDNYKDKCLILQADLDASEDREVQFTVDHDKIAQELAEMKRNQGNSYQKELNKL